MQADLSCRAPALRNAPGTQGNAESAVGAGEAEALHAHNFRADLSRQ